VALEFLRSECEDAHLRVALGDAAPLYRNASETREHRKSGLKRVHIFMRELLPDVPLKHGGLAADVIMTAMSDMFAAYIGTLLQAPTAFG
jgi:hypothetical protein